MTLRYDITKAIRKNAWLKVCIDCRQIAIKDTPHFMDYKVPKYFQNVTGSICPECFDNYMMRKKGYYG